MADPNMQNGSTQQQGYQQPTFGQLQQQGLPRPPKPPPMPPQGGQPQQPNFYYNQNGGGSGQPQSYNQGVPSGVQIGQMPPGYGPQSGQQAGGQQPGQNYWNPQQFNQQPFSYQQFQQPNGLQPFNQQQQDFSQNWLNNTDPYSTKTAQDTYTALGNRVSQQYDVQRQLAQEQSARQGLGSSTIAQGRLGDLGIRQGQTMGDIAAQIEQAQATTNAGARSQALAAAMGLSQNIFGQGANTYGLNLQGQNQNFQQGLQGYGAGLQGQNQNFNQNQSQDYYNNQLMLQLMGIT